MSEVRKKQPVPAAAALRYRTSQQDSPRLTAKGRGVVAEKILALARQSDVPVLYQPKLLELLMSVEVEEPIPEAAFEAVSEIYAFLIEMDENYARVLK
ncbi:hypothetical protein B1H10_05025 [candidate division KSB1 bacterium 4484_188]|nr:MAG: hypothetical protein B1H10_05025 [candidate division KSB1 bacterium 4484_188]HFE64943.1 hypothetical protein [Caldithrix sp.]